MAREQRLKRFLMTNDGMYAYTIDEPDVSYLHKQVDVLVGTQVDTLCWNVGHTGAYWYDTKVGTPWGAGLDKLPRARYYRLRSFLEEMLRQGIDPLRVLLERGQEKGIKVYPSVRIYDCQHGGQLDPLSREHPEWRIGEYPKYGPTAAYDPPPKTYLAQMDHARPEVRQRLIDVATELIERYPIEGIELDFERRPHFFKPDEAVANRHLLTDMLAQIRAVARQAAESRGQTVEVICRVWPDISDCENLGMDVRTWVAQGLVDTLVPTNHFFFALDYLIEDYVELVKDSPVSVLMAYCPVLDQFPRGDRPECWKITPAAGRPINMINLDTPYLISKEMWYGAAQMAFAKGVDGLATFNLKWALATQPENISILSEIGSPAMVATHDKLYPFITAESRNRPQPVTEEIAIYEFYIADAPEDVAQILLQVYVSETTTEDRIAFVINGQSVEMKRRLTCPDQTGGLEAPIVDPHHFFECDLKALKLDKGYHELSIQLIERNCQVSSQMVVEGVNIKVTM